ncbi:hypothetical protein C922_03818 [Plasmodium inui San Antonio 1]|uniref:Rab-GAP TBC domain-containing protein n=1 Tax=Plasmodium inui San Antonio 1 TaxID=1237626 RepID=W7A2C8_9APIC|nr:hypothetical protein C922_03818 [Plasmodium inui San Antonio 1]EUD65835.1 hypothetical protein C922_03818 [Plasmodium inui San Antonio 1]
MHLKGGGGRKKDDTAAGEAAAVEEATRNEPSKNERASNEGSKSKRGPVLRNQNDEMMEGNDEPDSCSVYDDTVEKNINFSESIIANLNDNIFEQKDAFTDQKLRGNFFILQEGMANGKQLDVYPWERRTSSASSSSSVRVRGGKVSLLFEDESPGGGGPSGQRTEIMSHSGLNTPYKGRSESTKWETSTKHEFAEEEEAVITPKTEQPRKNNTSTETNEKEKFVFPIKVNKKSWSKEKVSQNAYDEYNHNVIYHELYVELLQVNKGLQNEIKNLKRIIEMQKVLIKSREDLFGSSHMNEKNKISGKKFVNNNYFLNFFNKKKKKSKDSFCDVPTGSRVDRASASAATSAYASVKKSQEMEEDEKGGGYWAKGERRSSHRKKYYQAAKNGEKNKPPKWEPMDNNSDDPGYSKVEIDTIDNNEDMDDHNNEYVKLPLSENEGSVPSENASGGGSCDGNNSDSQGGSHRRSQRDPNHDDNSHTPLRSNNQRSYFFKRSNYEGLRGRNHAGGQKSYERGYQGGKKVDSETEPNEISVNFEEITALNITDYFVQILIKNTNFIQSYVYTNNQQYHNHVSKYFKSLITFRNSSLGGVQSDGPAMGDDAGSSGMTEKGEKSQVEKLHVEKSQGEKPKEEETAQRKDEDNCSAGLNLLQRFSFQKFFYQILIDLDRTLYIIKKNQEYFRKHGVSTDTFLLTLDLAEMKAKLNTLLQMYVVFKPELGYVQGMSYIALVFLLYCNLEKAFVHFANFMERKDIYNLYSFNNNEIKAYTYIIKEILTKQNVEIYKEISKQYNIDNIFIQWIYTIFLTCLPFHIFIRLFDIYLFNEKIIYETILCIFTYFNKFHHVENVDVVVKNLSAFSFNTHIQVSSSGEDKFWSLLKKSKIKKRKILYYREKYFKGHSRALH